MKTIPNKLQVSKAEKVKKIKQRNRDMGSRESFKKTYSSTEIVLEQIFQARLAKTIGACQCGRPLSLYKKIPEKPGYKCQCGKKIYPMKGTPLQGCKFDLTLMMEIFYFMFAYRNGLSTASISTDLKIHYDIVHNIRMKICDLMGNCIINIPFNENEPIEVDECYPYFETGFGPTYKFKRSIYSERCAMVISFVQRNGICKSFVYQEKNQRKVIDLFLNFAPKNITYYVDSSKLYSFFEQYGYYNYGVVVHRDGEFARGTVHTNTVEGYNSYIKTALHRIHKGVTFERMQAYLNNLSFNRSFINETPYEAFDLILKSLPPFELGNQIQGEEINNENNNTIEQKWKNAA
jgi:hypothetical protein